MRLYATRTHTQAHTHGRASNALARVYSLCASWTKGVSSLEHARANSLSRRRRRRSCRKEVFIRPPPTRFAPPPLPRHPFLSSASDSVVVAVVGSSGSGRKRNDSFSVHAVCACECIYVLVCVCVCACIDKEEESLGNASPNFPARKISLSLSLALFFLLLPFTVVVGVALPPTSFTRLFSLPGFLIRAPLALCRVCTTAAIFSVYVYTSERSVSVYSGYIYEMHFYARPHAPET